MATSTQAITSGQSIDQVEALEATSRTTRRMLDLVAIVGAAAVGRSPGLAS
jgi:hypothetical protein